jgi:hypothetical protein
MPSTSPFIIPVSISKERPGGNENPEHPPFAIIVASSDPDIIDTVPDEKHLSTVSEVETTTFS